jgi:hypothetical protein
MVPAGSPLEPVSAQLVAGSPAGSLTPCGFTTATRRPGTPGHRPPVRAGFAAVAALMGKRTTEVSSYRDRLLTKGTLVTRDAVLCFTVPGTAL